MFALALLRAAFTATWTAPETGTASSAPTNPKMATLTAR